MDESTSSTHRICSTKKCKTVLPPESIDKAKTCTTCREKDRLRKQTKRATEKRQREEQEHPPSRAAPKKPADNLSGYGNPFNDDSDAEEFSNPSLQYRNADEMFLALKKASEKIHISFHGQYIMPSDPLVTDRERFRDDRMLDAVFRYGGSFVRMMEACLDLEVTIFEGKTAIDAIDGLFVD
ncbi:hypothetical protein DFJ43DRAFT_1160825 [Lentinula guzmanii]|uniref:Uncharacterized protein n=1 Tax=Lentinula guzmanii TaxID=2804957 RepID=A0AA38MUZ0_9AGAR|nr:hypothetical protein DFJ43DRAFT_1160825 [Lentinula guzmanii]